MDLLNQQDRNKNLRHSAGGDTAPSTGLVLDNDIF